MVISMTIRVHRSDRVIPEYSLTGDLLAYLKCGRQYRLYNRGGLPPSVPVQQWFGEFIHGVLEEAFTNWRAQAPQLRPNWPWTWEQHIQPIEIAVYRRLLSRGLRPPPRMLYDNYDAPTAVGRGIASIRVEAALNTWGMHLFPLVEEAELRLAGSRELPASARARAIRYSITGIVDVLSSVLLADAPVNNAILQRLRQSPVVHSEINRTTQPFEIIVDYKGMRRPSRDNQSWLHQEWQLQTYAWLRRRQSPDSRVIAGVLLYLNELAPSRTDLRDLRRDVEQGTTDVMPAAADRAILLGEADTEENEGEEAETNADMGLSRRFLEDRSFRLVEITPATIGQAADEFDGVVGEIEIAVQQEISGGSALTPWLTRPDHRTCTACDFKYHCPDALSQRREPRVP
jgi:hypothetical protein